MDRIEDVIEEESVIIDKEKKNEALTKSENNPIINKEEEAPDLRKRDLDNLVIEDFLDELDTMQMRKLRTKLNKKVQNVRHFDSPLQ